jgi:hypothetical protein
MIDVKDIKLGFWIGAGLALFSLLISLLTRLANRTVKRDGG